ncbi:MAG: 16S rRNA (adenine(1518)-N(6)/adenine(1519)-N(6))-dimethyltransferase RsmA, partial [Rhodospirillales bacterium]|nr:16S rRNA (adenine(1518)-N(6)/adenine(1519)-N(6))-dimethyltransferase RsmA [Rhodospirillales bacterium]
MTDIENLPPLRDIIDQFDLRAKKSLGQNFLLDLNLTARIAKAAGPLDQCDVIEIGPGPGGLTRALLQAGARHVHAIERDERCVRAAQIIADASGGRLSIIEADALKLDVPTIGTAPRRIVANLPYNVATPLLLSWLHQVDSIESMTLMFQREVAERIVAKPGNKTYGRLSVITQWLCDARFEFDISPKAFTPPPKVTSSVITLTPRATPLAPATFGHLEQVTQAAFGQRRKMLRASLKSTGVNLAALDI